MVWKKKLVWNYLRLLPFLQNWKLSRNIIYWFPPSFFHGFALIKFLFSKLILAIFIYMENQTFDHDFNIFTQLVHIFLFYVCDIFHTIPMVTFTLPTLTLSIVLPLLFFLIRQTGCFPVLLISMFSTFLSTTPGFDQFTWFLRQNS